MIGKVITNKVQLSYAHVPEPLDVEQINADVSHVCATMPGGRCNVDEIIMWEHQWDWLTKPYRTREQPWQNLFPVDGPKMGRNTLFGIPVRFPQT